MVSPDRTRNYLEQVKLNSIKKKNIYNTLIASTTFEWIMKTLIISSFLKTYGESDRRISCQARFELDLYQAIVIAKTLMHLAGTFLIDYHLLTLQADN